MTLSPVETRVLGCLLEKERTTPESYPLTLNALIAACNQSTNRDPILTLGDREVSDALDELRPKKLATVIFGAGSRVQKYRHTLADIFNFTPQEYALLCVLLLRGPQTPGELRGRAERMAGFAALADVENVLNGLAALEEPLVRLLPARPGQKEGRYVQLLSGEPEEGAFEAGRDEAPRPASGVAQRVETLEREVGELRAELGEMRESFAELKRQLGG